MDIALTQIKAPAISGRYVQRPRLARLTRSRENAKLLFIGAPPGYGKTALASAFVASEVLRGKKCAWVTMGRWDNDPVRFWNLAAAALNSCDPSFNIAVPDSSTDFPHDTIASIVNHVLGHARSSYVLAIDNFQFASSPELVDQVSNLVSALPQNMSVLIASDSSLAFPASTLRMDDDLIEIYADDLRFRLDETEYYLNDCMHLNLSAREVKNIHHAVKGWPAGLRMAAQVIERGTSDDELIPAIEGMRASFFMDTVVSRKSSDMQLFLMRISHLPRVSPLLAQYVSEMQQSGALLAELEHDELFSDVSNESPPWYAFSKTFREALHQHALKMLPPGEIRALHQRASEWFGANGELMLAIDFALKAHLPARAAQIVTENLDAVLAQNHGDSLVSYLEMMDRENQTASQPMAVASAWAYCTAALPRQAMRWAALARSSATEENSAYSLLIDAVEARSNSLQGNFDAAVAQAEAAIAFIDANGLASSSPWLYLTIRHTLGESYMHLGDFDRAMDHLSYCVDMAVPSGRKVILYLAATELSELYASFGNWPEAERQVRAALRYQRKNLTEAPWSIALAQIQLATLLMHEGRLEEAEDMAIRARRRLNTQANADGELCLTFLEGQLALAHGDRPEASRLLSKALLTAKGNVMPRGKSTYISPLCIIHLIAIDDYPIVFSSMEDVLMMRVQDDPIASSLIELACASFSLSTGLPNDALERCNRILEQYEDSGLTTTAALAHITKSLALSATKDSRGATRALLEAATLLKGGNITYPLIAAGSRMGTLVEQTLVQCASASHAFQREKEGEIAFLRHCSDLMSRNPEPDNLFADLGLTQREQEVYRLLQSGKSRREIADELGISYNTVRVHVSNIYKKTQIGGDVDATETT